MFAAISCSQKAKSPPGAKSITFELTGACAAGEVSVFNDLICAGLGHEYKHPGGVGSSAGILCHVFLLPA